MAPREEEDLVDDEPPPIEPYNVLSISKTATDDEIKSAYRKAALKHHPDKAPPHLKEQANSKFQEIAFAYAILSDSRRRKRYDATGSTSESIDFDGFSWSDFYKEQFADIITSESIAKFSQSYKNSAEEKDDVLEAYRKSKGKWSGIYRTVMLSNPLEDEERFRGYIDEGIEKAEVKTYKAYTEETDRGKEMRMEDARREGKEAMAYAEELGVADKLFGPKGGKKESGEDALAQLILKRQVGRGKFFDHLEEKYGAKEKKPKAKKSKKRTSEDDEDEMPSEEAFQAAAARLKSTKNTKAGEASDGRKTKRTKR